jgi:hypothetical protein
MVNWKRFEVESIPQFEWHSYAGVPGSWCFRKARTQSPSEWTADPILSAVAERTRYLMSIISTVGRV